jgi:hypothetical protein
MKFSHHNLLVELNDNWWSEADTDRFFQMSRAYHAPIFYQGKWVFEVRIQDVGPVILPAGVGVFNDNPDEGSARERVLRLLHGFRTNAVIPPVEVAIAKADYGYRYKLLDGTYRLYCSLAAGFTHIPAISVADRET